MDELKPKLTLKRKAPPESGTVQTARIGALRVYEVKKPEKLHLKRKPAPVAPREQGAEGKRVSQEVQANLPPKGASSPGKKVPAEEKPRREFGEYEKKNQALLEYLRKTYPKAFFDFKTQARFMKPLAVNIRPELMKELKKIPALRIFLRKGLYMFMKWYARQPAYYACTMFAKNRVDLQGNPSPIKASERVWAFGKLNECVKMTKSKPMYFWIISQLKKASRKNPKLFPPFKKEKKDGAAKEKISVVSAPGGTGGNAQNDQQDHGAAPETPAGHV